MWVGKHMGIISECMYLGMYVDMYAYTFVFGWVDMDVCVHTFVLGGWMWRLYLYLDGWMDVDMCGYVYIGGWMVGWIDEWLLICV